MHASRKIDAAQKTAMGEMNTQKIPPMTGPKVAPMRKPRERMDDATPRLERGVRSIRREMEMGHDMLQKK